MGVRVQRRGARYCLGTDGVVIGVPTTVSIYFQANESLFRYGAGGFGLVDPDGTPSDAATPDRGLFYDVDGPDNTDFTEDDGWVWANILGGGFFIPDLNPLSTGLICGCSSPFRVPPNERLLAATLEITGTELGAFHLVPSLQHFDESFVEIIIKEGAEPVFTVTPEPTTAALLAFGAITVWGRRHKRV